MWLILTCEWYVIYKVSLAAAKGELLEKIKERDLRQVDLTTKESIVVEEKTDGGIVKSKGEDGGEEESGKKMKKNGGGGDGSKGHGGRHVCSECSKGFSTLSNLARHRQTHLSLSSSSVKKCPHCDKMYVSMPAFSMHLRTHNQVSCFGFRLHNAYLLSLCCNYLLREWLGVYAWH